jgi:hypothetical protein
LLGYGSSLTETVLSADANIPIMAVYSKKGDSYLADKPDVLLNISANNLEQLDMGHSSMASLTVNRNEDNVELDEYIRLEEVNETKWLEM